MPLLAGLTVIRTVIGSAGGYPAPLICRPFMRDCLTVCSWKVCSDMIPPMRFLAAGVVLLLQVCIDGM